MIPESALSTGLGLSGAKEQPEDSDHDDEEDDEALRQNKNLRRFRFTFTMVMFVISLGLALGIFFLKRGQEKEAFRLEFEDRASKVIDTVHLRISQKLSALESFSFSITSYSNFKGFEWPFVTIPDFEVKAASTRALCNSASLMFYPIVNSSVKEAWEAFTVANRGWVADGRQFEEEYNSLQERKSPNRVSRKLQAFTEYISYIDDFGYRLPVKGEGPFVPSWQTSPVAERLINLDLNTTDAFSLGVNAVMETGRGVIGRTLRDEDLDGNHQTFENSWDASGNIYYDGNGPVSTIFFPVFGNLDSSQRNTVGFITSIAYWESLLQRILPSDRVHLDIVIKNTCGDVYSYHLEGENVFFSQRGDGHESRYDDMLDSAGIFTIEEEAQTVNGIPFDDICNYMIYVYPTTELEAEFVTGTPWVFFALVIAIFTLTTMFIYFYDWKVEKNYQETYKKAKQAGAIVSSIFPATVRRRLYEEDNSNNKTKGQGAFKQQVPTAVNAQKDKLKSLLNEETPGETTDPKTGGADNDENVIPDLKTEKAIADLFPNTTILFADIVGFTAWSSQREPGEVFTLLQTLYHEFDSVARMLKVFKVETIGDCYVAATGLPEPQPDHAIRMAKFASKIMSIMIDVTRQLEVHLGPDTGELRARVGMHSGPVTAGVLRGAKARFQLFGDTMNFAARMEAHSAPNQIQCSEYTANLLREAGKEQWLRPRVDKVKAKGKGELQTYWVVPRTVVPGEDYQEEFVDSNAAVEDEYANPLGNNTMIFDLGTPGNRAQRLIDWNVELLAGLLRHIEARRRDLRMRSNDAPTMELKGGSTALDEVTEIINLPQFNTNTKNRTRPEDVELSMDVVTQLRDYVTTIASMYRDNPFHNFEHASHVSMNTNKLLKRVTIRHADNGDINESDLHQYTYGITSDPLTQFTLVFCALVHDVDHAGVSNFQLIKEGATIAKLYKNKSVAEQNSVDLAWDLLMDPNYKELQKAIYSNEDELKRFRQLMVNIVLATDIFDQDMKAIRERRWGKAFQYEEEEENEIPNQPIKALDRDYNKPLSEIEGTNLKATIVLEHLIQASDVAHTMQHWQIYLKWNERLFREMMNAFHAGRAAKDPSIGWYEGEIMFFDKYVIPLAKKLDDCGVFGVSSDECLNYAQQNRKQWAIQGDELVKDMLNRFYGTKGGE